MTIFLLSPLDQICLDCPIPGGCNENPRCPWRLAKAAGNVSQRRPGWRERVLEYLAESPDIWYSIVDVARAVNAPRSTVTGILQRLRQQGKVEHTGKKRTLRVRAVSGDGDGVSVAR